MTTRTRLSKSKQKVKSANFGLWLIGASVLLVALGVGLVILNNRPSPPVPSAPIDLPAEWINGKVLGDPAATVTIHVWEDFLCPHCRDWTTKVEPQLFTEYIKTGKARLQFHLLPLQSFAPASSMAGLAAECAAEQNLFWQYHDRLFAAQDQGQAGYREGGLIDMAQATGLDKTQFTQCLTNRKHQQTVDASLQEAISLGLNSTPSLFVNDQQITYPFDYPAIQTAIEQVSQ
jgi:protein-disulfide isomerase